MPMSAWEQYWRRHFERLRSLLIGASLAPTNDGPEPDWSQVVALDPASGVGGSTVITLNAGDRLVVTGGGGGGYGGSGGSGGAAIGQGGYGGGAIGTGIYTGPESPVSTQPDPRIAAESLLFSILPREMYIELAAVDKCTWRSEVSENIYTLSKKNKTVVVKKDGSKWSACIAPEPLEMLRAGEFPFTEFTVYRAAYFTASQPLPTADRVAAEYLLLINDEPRYLTTANLTQIGDYGRREQSSTWFGRMWRS